jgi:methyl-accepting chemotaxis protein
MASHLRRSRAQEVLPLATVGLRHVALLLPVGVILVTSLVLTDYCRQLLATAGQAAPVLVDHITVTLVLGGFLLAAAALVVVQAGRVAARVEGPERRLVQALRRMRDGDLTFRVHLRRGDPLGGVARECNELLDWLNAHPPVGARVGGDIVEVEEDRVAEVAP